MTPTPLLLAHVEPDGAIVFADLRAVTRALMPHRGKDVEVVVRRRRSKRSLAQNRWLWGLALPLIADEVGYDRHELELLHAGLLARRFGTRRDPILKADVPNQRSSKLTTREFSDYMEWLVRFAAEELGIVVPLPDDVDLDAYEAVA